MRKTLYLTLSLFCTIVLHNALFAQNNNEDFAKRLNGIEEELRAVLDSFQAPGFAVSVVAKDQVIFAQGFGYRNYEEKIPVDANTLFAIGSCSKAFTTSLLGLLREKGKVAFDESPRAYLPVLSFYNDEMNNGITLKDLMCHQTGLPRHDAAWYFFPNASKKELIKRVAFQEPFSGVRESWYYNNFMFLAQGLIVEEISGKSWEENVAEHLFKPLGMTQSNATIDGLKKGDNAAFGYELKDNKEIRKMAYYDISGMSPAGSINSSVAEMANWVITWINGGEFQGDTILPASFVRDAISSQAIIGGALPSKKHPDLHFSNYGYGWFLSSYKGHYRVAHGGNIDGFSANTSFFPSDSIGIVVLTNQNGSPIPAVVRNIVADRVLGLEYSDWTKEIKAQRDQALNSQANANKNRASNRKLETQASHPLQAFTGNYSHPGYGTFEVTLERDSLFAKTPSTKFWLRHFHYNVFEPLEVKKNGIDTTALPAELDLRMNFTSNNSGEINQMTIKIEPMVDPIAFKRTPKEMEVDQETLLPYVGDYELAGMVSKIYIREENTLMLFVPGQPEYELAPIGKHKFVIKGVEGYQLEFKESDQGSIASVLFIQPNGTFEATRK